jgi:4-hydroxy-tetrahydrodipicolinate synthase
MTRLTKDTLRGFVPAVATPFDARGEIMEDAFAALVGHLVGIGAQGICVAGDNGESWALTLAERRRLTRLAVDRCAGRVPVIMGATAPGAQQTIDYARAAVEAGAAGVLVMPQTYVMKATREELLRRFERLAGAVDVPIVLYNSPRRAVIELSIDDVAAIGEVAPVVGIKESNRDIGHLTRLLRRMAGRIAVMVGPAYYILAGSALGAAGFIATGPEFLGETAGRLMEIGRRAPDAEYVAAHQKLTIVYETLMALGTWPSALKAGLNLLGLPAGVPRDPLMPLGGAPLDRLRATLDELGLLPAGTAR